MRRNAIREHLKFLLRMQSKWDWWTQGSWGVFSGKVRIITGSSELVLDKKGLEAHIARTKKNLERAT